jgi:pimeloyl-ACP methyl ester carboxylesterase
VSFVLEGVEALSAKVGPQYNLIGIDPRGVNNSGPDLSCFPGYPTAARNAFYAEVFYVPDDTSAYGLQKSFQTIGAWGDWCTDVYSVNDTAKYTNTAAVANDFLHYIELAAQEKGRQPSEAKLNYYGISYGTVLGATFASLFPDRIQRMVLDGVVDSEDYYAGGWKTATLDSEEAVRAFFKTCFDAGPELCAFHQNATSWEQLEERYDAIFASLKQAPIPVADPLSSLSDSLDLVPGLVTWQDLLQAMFSYSYFPTTQFPALAAGLAELELGNGTLLHLAKPASRIATPGEDSASDAREGRTAVLCLDANGRFNTSTIKEYTEYVEFMKNQSSYGGLVLAGVTGPLCRKLDIFPPESQAFDGRL